MLKPIISPDQNTITFQDKSYQFVEDPADICGCNHCDLLQNDICHEIPCEDKGRFDLKLGHFILTELCP